MQFFCDLLSYIEIIVIRSFLFIFLCFFSMILLYSRASFRHMLHAVPHTMPFSNIFLPFSHAKNFLHLHAFPEGLIFEIALNLVKHTIYYSYRTHALLFLTLQCVMSQNGQTHFKNLAANAARFLNCV